MDKYKNILKYGMIVLYCIAMFTYYGYEGVELFKERDRLILITMVTFFTYSALYMVFIERIKIKDYLIIGAWSIFSAVTAQMSSFFLIMFWYVLRGSKNDKQLIAVFTITQLILFVSCAYLTRHTNLSWWDHYLVLGFTNPNKTSFHLFTILAGFLYITKDSKYRFNNYLITLAIAVIFYRYTHSRALLATMYAMSLYVVPKCVYDFTIQKFKFAIFSIPWAFFTGSVFLAFYYNHTEVNDFSSTRLALWNKALSMMTRYIFGDMNVFNYKEVFARFTVDSDFINALYAFGIVGAFVSFSFIGYCLYVMLIKRKYTEMVIVISILVYGLFEQVFFSCANFALIIIAILVARGSGEKEGIEDERS